MSLNYHTPDSTGDFLSNHLPVAVGNKHHISDQEVVLSGFIGDVAGKEQAILYDDEIASGGSTMAMVDLLLQHGLHQVRVVYTHGVFTGTALERLGVVPELVEIVTSDTVPIPEDKRIPKLRVLSVAPLFSEAICRNWLRQSIGDLFAFWEEFKPED